LLNSIVCSIYWIFRDGCLKAAGGEVGFALDDELLGAARGLWAARAALEVRGLCDWVFGLWKGAWLVRETGGDPGGCSVLG
jgi:hypothetical protein